MSYHLPPNNNIDIITDPNQPEELRRQLFEMDQQLQLADHNNTPEGMGAVRGWGTGRSRGRRR